MTMIGKIGAAIQNYADEEVQWLRKRVAELEYKVERAEMLRKQTAEKLEQVRGWWLEATKHSPKEDPTTCSGDDIRSARSGFVRIRRLYVVSPSDDGQACT